MNSPKNKNSLDGMKKPPRKLTPQEQQQEAQKIMAQFYDTMHSGMINMVAIMAKVAEMLGDISTDTNDMAFYAKHTAIKNQSVSLMEVEEHEKEEDEPPANSESNKSE